MAASHSTPSVRVESLRRDCTLESRPQSDVVNEHSTIYASQYFNFSQPCVQENDNLITHPASTSSVHLQNVQRRVKANGRSSVVRVAGSQLVTVLRDDQASLRRSTLSEITQKFTEQKKEWVEDRGVNVDTEMLVKQREHRAKADKVLAKLLLEQEALEREEREETEEREKADRLEEEGSAWGERIMGKGRLELRHLEEGKSCDEDNTSVVSETDQGWKVDQESITSSRWAWDHIEERNRHYQDEVAILVDKFKAANSKVWQEVIHHYKTIDHLPEREPLNSITNGQQRDRRSAILRLQAKRQRQLEECAEVQNGWTSNGDRETSESWF
ncbi:hypothetical protein GYMLUDRAFT_36064 [Collybiopsis luxurians FD-317 M1]|nr:hypothetical protein GYMLUDRAFT_36064 [Collybiopsis luxurians FD-317 M1]